MKKISLALGFVGLLVGVAPAQAGGVKIDPSVNKFRAMKCSIPRMRERLNCTPKEIAEGKKWLSGTAIAAAVAALAGLIAGGIKLEELRQAKAQAYKPAQIFAKYNITLTDDRRALINAIDLSTLLRVPKYRQVYDQLMENENFAKALAESRNVTVDQLPKPRK